jgi:hypothetical protein
MTLIRTIKSYIEALPNVRIHTTTERLLHSVLFYLVVAVLAGNATTYMDPQLSAVPLLIYAVILLLYAITSFAAMSMLFLCFVLFARWKWGW